MSGRGQGAGLVELPWVAERQVEVDDARALATAAFGMPCRTLRGLGEGWDFVAFLVDDDWVLRIPKRADADRALVRERAILDHLQSLDLPAAVPCFEYFSDPQGPFPWHVAAYRLIPGDPLSQQRVDDAHGGAGLAGELGEFLAALHSTTADLELASPWDEEEDRVWMRREFEGAVDAYPAALRHRIERFLHADPVPDPAVPRVFAHADLLSEHILVDPQTGRLTGIIDWADASTTIRSSDFAGIHYEWGRELTERAYVAYGRTPDAQEWRWLEQQVVAIGIGQVFYGHHDQRPHLVARAIERIANALPG